MVSCAQSHAILGKDGSKVGHCLIRVQGGRTGNVITGGDRFMCITSIRPSSGTDVMVELKASVNVCVYALSSTICLKSKIIIMVIIKPRYDAWDSSSWR